MTRFESVLSSVLVLGTFVATPSAALVAPNFLSSEAACVDNVRAAAGLARDGDASPQCGGDDEKKPKS